jgi:hypothetical protein
VGNHRGEAVTPRTQEAALAALAVELLQEANRAAIWHREDVRTATPPRLSHAVATGILRQGERALGEAGLKEVLREPEDPTP